MAVYMHVDGITGSASQSHHEGWISLQEMKLPTERPDVNTAPGNVTDRTTSAVDFKDIEITKYMDVASPGLMQWNIDGITRPVIIEVCKENGQRVLRLELSDVILTNYESTSDEEGKIEESIYLDYTKIIYNFQEYDKSGKPDKNQVIEYDLETAG